MAATKRTTKKSTAKTSAKSTAKKVEATVESTLRNAAEEISEQTESVMETLNANVNAAQNLAKQLWFANLGIYGRVFEEVQTRATRLNKEGVELVTDLVSRGEKFQDDAQNLLKEGRSNVEDQVEQVRATVANISPVFDVTANMKKMSERFDALRKSVLKAA